MYIYNIIIYIYIYIYIYYIYYGDVILGYMAGYLTMKTTYNNALYLFVDSLAWRGPSLADLKVTMVSHMIDEFKFQQKEEIVSL